MPVKTRKLASPPPPPQTSTSGSRVAVSRVESDIRSHAEWIDRHLGNRDGFVDGTELAKFAERYGRTAGYQQVIDGIGDALEPVSDASARPAAPISADQHATLVRAMVKPGGSGTAEDVAAFLPDVAKIPSSLLQAARARKISIVVCRNDVSDPVVALRGQTPRGWPPGSDWSQVPGTFAQAQREVVVATGTGPDGSRLAKQTGDGHGAYSLLLHEFAHGLDRMKAVKGFDSNDARFKRAYDADAERLRASGETYLLQPGVAGREEAFAELFARYFGGDPDVRTEYPNLSAWFARFEGNAGALS